MSNIKSNSPGVLPPYSPSVQLFSLCFFCDELLFTDKHIPDQVHFKPVLLEINSTQLNIFVLKYKYNKYANYYLSHLQMDSESRNDSIDQKQSTFRKKILFYLNLTDKVEMTNRQLSSSNSSLIRDLLNYQPNLHELPLSDSKERISALQSIKGDLFKTFSMQESVDFGSAVGLDNKPNTLRMVFPSHQFLITSYNAEQFVQLFYKLNVSKEVSLDFELRSIDPKAFGLPIQPSSNDNDRARTSKNKLGNFDLTVNQIELVVKSMKPCPTRFEDFKNRTFKSSSFPTAMDANSVPWSAM